MFIKNAEVVDCKYFVLVDHPIKRYLESMGFCPVTYNSREKKWAFQRTDTLENILSQQKGGSQK